MTENYLQILTESLEKKLDVLDRISEVNKRQFEVSTKRPFDMEAYDAVMDEKATLIEELNHLDEGFTSTYELVREEVQKEPENTVRKCLGCRSLSGKLSIKGSRLRRRRNATRLLWMQH